MLPHQQRVVDEKTSLDEKLDKLTSFMFDNVVFKSLPADEQLRLRRQLDVMKEYSSILAARIEAF